MVNQSLLKLALKSGSKNSGFTMMEVLVSILVSFAFLMGTLQAMAINVFFQVKAEREAQGRFWIEEDIALVTSIAATDNSPVTCPLSTNATNGFGQRLKATLGMPTVTVQAVGNRELVNKNYRLVRIASVDANKPDILQITYRVGIPDDADNNDLLDDDETIVAENYARFFPVDALSCP